MKKYALTAALLAAFLSGSIAPCLAEESYQPPPLFLAGEVPPLLMLVMGRDHKLYYEAYNDASDLNGDNVLDIGFNPAIDYYGYFDCYKCYTYDTSGKIFNPSSVTATKKCSNAWSGNFLNYVTMSRMDTMRKVLYGGSRSTDAADSTVLQRVYIPQDAHSWGKSYRSVARDKYDIREYTPLDLPRTNTQHLFASTTLSDGGAPLFRVLNDSTYKIWEWVSIERPVAGTKCLNGGSGPACEQANNWIIPGDTTGDTYFVDPVTSLPSLQQQFYTIRKCCRFDSTKSDRLTSCKALSGSTNPKYCEDAPAAPADHAAFDAYVSTYAIDSRKFCATPLTLTKIKGAANSCGYDDYYLNRITGKMYIPAEDDYIFAIDGDDAVELMIDGTVVVGWYGEHAACGTDAAPCYTHTGTVHLTAGEHTIEFRHEEHEGDGRYRLYMKQDAPDSEMTDYEVRVKVCDSSVGLEPNCSTYTDNSGVKHYKPTGILQHYGEADRMYFGLLTGSYKNNLQGGVLRKNIKSLKDEVNLETGQFTAVDGIIKTIDKFKVRNFSYSDHSYSECFGIGGAKSLAGNNGKCKMWGNPIAEMMYESLRYFAGKKTPTSSFSYSSSTDDDALGLPKPEWLDPYTSDTSKGFTAYSYCSKPFMLVLSDINPSYDSDNIPGNPWATVSTDLGSFSGQTLANAISGYETSKPTNYFIGDQIGQTYLGACTEKTNGALGDIRGLCPEEPTKQGSYYAAAAAYYGKKTDLNTVAGGQKVSTYAVAMSSPLPKIDIPVGDYKITLVPFAKSVGGSSDISVARGGYQPTNAIVDFYITTLLPTYGEFQINYEDVEQGSDHDMDAICAYTYQVVDNAGNPVADYHQGKGVKIKLESPYAAGGIMQHMGYIISGTTKDGTYLEVRDKDTSEGSDPDYFLDTPPGIDPNTGPGDTNWDDDTHLPLSSTRTFYPDASGGSVTASLLKDPLWYAAKWGGFNDIDGNSRPDTQAEWDEDNDGQPDTYFYVTNALKLEEQLNKSFADIVKKAGSGTAVSVLATKGEGEGTILQAYFKPKVTDDAGINTITWAGYMQALWVDPYGNLREDSDTDAKYDPTKDKIIDFFQDSVGDTKVRRYAIDNDNPYSKDGATETIYMEELVPLWEAGKNLWNRSAAVRASGSSDGRRIFTSIDGSTIDFSAANMATLKPYLAVGTAESTFLGTALNDRATNLIHFIRGMSDDPGDAEYAYTGNPVVRRRSFKIGSAENTWKLGDIVYSTPLIVSRPVESYHQVYEDTTYKAFYDKYANRETVAYVGANDGMLHAFSFGVYDDALKKFTTGATVGKGEELWAYVPRCQLPHLRMLAKQSYAGSNHLSFVDLKPKVLDAKIFDDNPADTKHPKGWASVLVVGMNMGGSPIEVTDAAFTPGGKKTFYSSYAAIDVTDPANPVVLWESDFDGALGYTTSTPSVVKVQDKWFLAIGSGPTSYDGKSTQNGKVLIVDIKTGVLKKALPFTTDETLAFMSSLVGLDKNLNYSVAALYVGTTYSDSGQWLGRIWKLAIPQKQGGTYAPSCKTCYDENPNQWVWSKMADLPAPVTAPLTLTVDRSDNVWVLAGTGRFLNSDDKVDGSQNYLFGIKDPFYNRRGIAKTTTTGLPTCYNSYTDTCPLTISDLFNADAYAVKADGTIEIKSGFTDTLALGGSSFDDFVTNGVKKKTTGTNPLEMYQGWYRRLPKPPHSCPCECTATACEANPPCMADRTCPTPCKHMECKASERVLNKPVAFGGVALFPTFTPIPDPCMSGGNSYLYGLYLETGTAYKKAVFKTADNSAINQDSVALGFGLASCPAIHAGKEQGESATGFMQMSTGQIVQIAIDPIFNVKSGMQFWRDGR